MHHPAIQQIVAFAPSSNLLPKEVHVLVVEDDEDDYELITWHLRHAKFAAHCRRVDNEESMRGALNSAPWDLVISDHRLPCFSSDAALALVNESGFDLPFIIVSGAIGEEAAVEAMRAGADDYVMKHQPAKLIAAIERSLRAAAERRARRKAEAEHSASLRRFQAITANIPGVVLRVMFDARTARLSFPYISEGATQLLGTDAAQLVAEPDHFLTRLDTESKEQLIAAVTEAARDMAPLRWKGEARTQEFCWRVLQLSATHETGQADIHLWDGILTDVTQEHEALEALRTSQTTLSNLTAHLESMMERQRAIIAREIHDDMGGQLTAIKADLAWLKQRCADDVVTLEKIKDMDGLADSLVQAAKRIAKWLRPAILDQGIAAALEWQAREFEKHIGLPCKFTSNSDEVRLDPGASTGVFRVFQEALTNVAKHARASQVEVQLFATPSALTLEVRDDGVGLSPADLDKPDSFGVRGMHERVKHLGGWLEVNGAKGRGTTLMLSVPRSSGRSRG